MSGVFKVMKLNERNMLVVVITIPSAASVEIWNLEKLQPMTKYMARGKWGHVQ